MLREPPQNIEAEMGVLGSILQEPDMLHEIAAILKPEDFYRDLHGKTFQVMIDLAESSVPIDLTTVSDELSRRGSDILGSGFAVVRQIMDNTPNSANALYYAGIVKAKAIPRRYIEECNEILRLAYDGETTSEQLVAEAERRLMAIGECTAKDNSVSIHRALVGVMNTLSLREQGTSPGTPTGFDDLDDMTDGLHAGKLYIVAARPGNGKSAFGLNVADHVAYEGGKPCLFISLEMSANELAERFLMARGRIDGDMLRYPQRMGASKRREAERVVQEVSPRSRLTIEDPDRMTITQLAARARRHKHRHGLGLLVVDYLQLVDGQPRKNEIREQEVARISRRLKGIAKELRVPVIALCQLNRAIENREDKKPRLADLRESGQIEQDADVVMLLHYPGASNPADVTGRAMVYVAKNRGGKTGVVELSFVPSQTRFVPNKFIPPAAHHHFPDESPF